MTTPTNKYLFLDKNSYEDISDRWYKHDYFKDPASMQNKEEGYVIFPQEFHILKEPKSDTIITVSLEGIMSFGIHNSGHPIVGPFRWNNIKGVVNANLHAYENNLAYQSYIRI